MEPVLQIHLFRWQILCSVRNIVLPVRPRSCRPASRSSWFLFPFCLRRDAFRELERPASIWPPRRRPATQGGSRKGLICAQNKESNAYWSVQVAEISRLFTIQPLTHRAAGEILRTLWNDQLATPGIIEGGGEQKSIRLMTSVFVENHGRDCSAQRKEYRDGQFHAVMHCRVGVGEGRVEGVSKIQQGSKGVALEHSYPGAERGNSYARIARRRTLRTTQPRRTAE